MQSESHTHSRAAEQKWQFWIERGGTFTDIVVRRPDGQFLPHKLLSHNPAQYPDAAFAGIRQRYGVELDDPKPTEFLEAVKMSTTVATDALRERKAWTTSLFIHRRFKHALKNALEGRLDIFSSEFHLVEVLYAHVVEVDERVLPEGS